MVILLVEQDTTVLDRLRNADCSEMARRSTYMFELLVGATAADIPLPDRYRPEGLIHRAEGGTPMRSKSEVIVYEVLKGLGLDPEYEQRLYAPVARLITAFRISHCSIGGGLGIGSTWGCSIGAPTVRIGSEKSSGTESTAMGTGFSPLGIMPALLAALFTPTKSVPSHENASLVFAEMRRGDPVDVEDSR